MCLLQRFINFLVGIFDFEVLAKEAAVWAVHFVAVVGFGHGWVVGDAPDGKAGEVGAFVNCAYNGAEKVAVEAGVDGHFFFVVIANGYFGELNFYS